MVVVAAVRTTVGPASVQGAQHAPLVAARHAHVHQASIRPAAMTRPACWSSPMHLLSWSRILLDLTPILLVHHCVPSLTSTRSDAGARSHI
jgi:hypothetical protein